MEITPAYRKILSGEAHGVGAACLRLILFLLSVPYGLVVWFRNWLYNIGLRPEHRVDKPVICIGNITAGGTGKTPAVEYVVKWLVEQGARPAILSRGYRSQDGGNDEAMLLAQRLPDIPHRQDPDRFRAAVGAIKLDNANVLVLDDGFQHRRLARFANIVLIDATCPFGFGHLLPRGLLREPLSGLRRADAIIITRADLVEETTLTALKKRIRKFAPTAPVATARHAPTALSVYPDGAAQPPAILAGKNIGLFCSIGNPRAFQRTARQLDANILWSAEFSDHHWYTQEDIAAITRAENTAVELFVTTEKDAVKLGDKWPADRKLVVLRVEMEILSGDDKLTGLFREALKAALYGEE